MTTKTKIGLAAVALAVTFAAGRYSVQNPDVKQVIDSTTNNNITTDKEKHKKIIIVKEKYPDGKSKTTTTITDDMTTHSEDKSITETHSDTTVTAAKTGTTNISLLAGLDTSRSQMAYGASVTREVLGPITIGAFGLTNGVVGASLGVSF